MERIRVLRTRLPSLFPAVSLHLISSFIWQTSHFKDDVFHSVPEKQQEGKQKEAKWRKGKLVKVVCQEI